MKICRKNGNASLLLADWLALLLFFNIFMYSNSSSTNKQHFMAETFCVGLNKFPLNRFVTINGWPEGEAQKGLAKEEAAASVGFPIEFYGILKSKSVQKALQFRDLGIRLTAYPFLRSGSNLISGNCAKIINDNISAGFNLI